MAWPADTNPLISVILSTFNHEKYIVEALDGVLAQSYAPLEIVIVDDGSPDSTADIIAAHLARHPSRGNIPFVRLPENTRGTKTVPTGLEQTRGDFIVLTSGDDVMFPDMVAEMAKVWIAEVVSLVTTNAYYIDENSTPLNRTHRDPSVRADDSFETLARDGGNSCCFGATIGFERAVYDRFGWPPLYLGTFDIMFPFYASLLKGTRYIEKPLLSYRVHSRNLSLSLRGEKLGEVDRLLLDERILAGHIAHALLMQEQLDRLVDEDPHHYAEVRQRIGPLLAIQLVEMTKKFNKARIALFEAGVVLGRVDNLSNDRAGLSSSCAARSDRVTSRDPAGCMPSPGGD